MKLNEMIKEIALISPETLAEDWDNGGIQLNSGSEDINKILVALEITDDVIDEAIEKNVDMIITHHPFIFQPIKAILDDWLGKSIIRLIHHNISVYACHTSFDSVIGGNNDELARLLGLQVMETIEKRKEDPKENLTPGLGRIGEFNQPISLEEVAHLLKSSLAINHPIHYVGVGNSLIKRVALCTGSGADFIDVSSKKGCQLLITGDIKYHDAQGAKQLGIALIDATHFHTENIFIENMARQLKEAVGTQIEIIQSQISINPFQYF